MNEALELSAAEVEDLYVLLKPKEEDLDEGLAKLLHRVERSLYGRLTLEELESLSRRFAPGR